MQRLGDERVSKALKATLDVKKIYLWLPFVFELQEKQEGRRMLRVGNMLLSKFRCLGGEDVSG